MWLCDSFFVHGKYSKYTRSCASAQIWKANFSWQYLVYHEGKNKKKITNKQKAVDNNCWQSNSTFSIIGDKHLFSFFLCYFKRIVFCFLKKTPSHPYAIRTQSSKSRFMSICLFTATNVLLSYSQPTSTHQTRAFCQGKGRQTASGERLGSEAPQAAAVNIPCCTQILFLSSCNSKWWIMLLFFFC